MECELCAEKISIWAMKKKVTCPACKAEYVNANHIPVFIVVLVIFMPVKLTLGASDWMLFIPGLGVAVILAWGICKLFARYRLVEMPPNESLKNNDMNRETH